VGANMRLTPLHWSFRLEAFRGATKDRSLGRSLQALAEKYRSNSDPLSNFEEMNENHKYLRNRFPYLAMLDFLGFQVELQETCREPVLGDVGLSIRDECNYTSRYERCFSLLLRTQMGLPRFSSSCVVHKHPVFELRPLSCAWCE
jgi:hypothetical protein